MEEVVEMEALKIVGDGKSQNRYCERVFSDFPQGIASTSQYQVCVPASDLANWWPDEAEHGRMDELGGKPCLAGVFQRMQRRVA